MKKEFSESEYEIFKNFLRGFEGECSKFDDVNQLHKFINEEYESGNLEVDEYKFLSDPESLEHLYNVFRDLEIVEDELGELEEQRLCCEEKREDLLQGKIICYEEMYAVYKK